MKKLVVLLSLLAIPLSASSQTLSIKEDYCSVPCRTLQNALLVKAERDFLKGQLVVTRDSISILSNVITSQDSLITTQDSTIALYKTNEETYLRMMGNKDMIIRAKDDIIKEERKKAKLAWLTTGLSVVGLILTLL